MIYYETNYHEINNIYLSIRKVLVWGTIFDPTFYVCLLSGPLVPDLRNSYNNFDQIRHEILLSFVYPRFELCKSNILDFEKGLLCRHISQ